MRRTSIAAGKSFSRGCSATWPTASDGGEDDALCAGTTEERDGHPQGGDEEKVICARTSEERDGRSQGGDEGKVIAPRLDSR